MKVLKTFFRWVGKVLYRISEVLHAVSRVITFLIETWHIILNNFIQAQIDDLAEIRGLVLGCKSVCNDMAAVLTKR